MKCAAAFVRRARRIARRLFGASYVPIWLDDMTAAFAPLRKINLLFTLTAIASTPDHFFSLTTPLVTRKRRLYASPIAFLLWQSVIDYRFAIGQQAYRAGLH
jgi:hypothetical protein